MRRFIAEVPQIVMWDDHEVLDNWYWERRKDADARYTEKSVAVLAARARQAFVEYNPLPLFGDDPERIYRSIPAGSARRGLRARHADATRARTASNRQPAIEAASSAIFGPAQLQWLKDGAQARARRRGRSSPPTCRSASSSATARTATRRWPTAIPARRSDASSRSPTCCRYLKRERVKQRRLDHRRRALLRRAPLPSGAGEVHRLRSVLGVRRRPAQRRHVRAGHARRDVRPGAEVRRHPAGHEGRTVRRRTASSSSARCASARRRARSPPRCTTFPGERSSRSNCRRPRTDRH